MGTMDELIDAALVGRLRDSVQRAAPGTDVRALEAAQQSVDGLHLRQRVDVVRDSLLEDLPIDFTSVERVARSLLELPHFTGWMIWPASEWAATRALDSGSESDFDAGMALLTELTARLSSEFAVRELLLARPERGLQVMRTWTQHPDVHVRRLASEGSRAYLPWGRRVPWLITHPRSTLPLLDALYRDESEYVRRSVANHLNDLSRVDPAVVTEVAARWAAEPDDHTRWVLRHGLRTLVKKGDPTALRLVGFTGTDLQVGRPVLSARSVAWNGSLSFSATITNDGPSEARVAIDYSIGFRRANGAIRPRTFKLASRRIAPGESVVVDKTHSFRPISTRKHYPGEHFVTVQANGVVSGESRFTLSPDGTGSTPRSSR
ncbi:DNA alkylation repair protein [Alloalcanivorax gelatiniphagus]